MKKRVKMKKSVKIQNVLMICGLVLLILNVTLFKDIDWLGLTTTVIYIFVLLIDWAIWNIDEKIKNVNEEELKQLIKNGKKSDAVKKIRKDNKCSLLSARLYVADLEAVANKK